MKPLDPLAAQPVLSSSENSGTCCSGKLHGAPEPLPGAETAKGACECALDAPGDRAPVSPAISSVEDFATFAVKASCGTKGEPCGTEALTAPGAPADDAPC